MDLLIRLRSTGNPNEFADKINISLRSLYDYLRVLRELGAPLVWSVYHNSYIYENSGKLQMKFLPDPSPWDYYINSQSNVELSIDPEVYSKVSG